LRVQLFLSHNPHPTPTTPTSTHPTPPAPGTMHHDTYNQQVTELTKWFSNNCGMNAGPTLSLLLDRHDTTEEEKLQFEQLEQFILQLQSINGAVPKYTRTGRKTDTLLITFKNTGARHNLAMRMGPLPKAPKPRAAHTTNPRTKSQCHHMSYPCGKFPLLHGPQSQKE
jgi:hypothetical protein